MKTLYSTQATVTDGRSGTATLSDSSLKINMAAPGTDQGSNPEQLLAMGYAACFDSALGVVKKTEDAKLTSVTQATIDLMQGDEHDYQLAIALHVIASNTDLSAEQVQQLVEKAHEVCPYSKATRNNVDVKVTSEIK